MLKASGSRVECIGLITCCVACISAIFLDQTASLSDRYSSLVIYTLFPSSSHVRTQMNISRIFCCSN